MPEHEPESFIKTPLEFFEHSYEDMYFGYPQEYHEELSLAKAAALAEIEDIATRRALFLAGDPEAQRDRYVSSEEEVKLSIAYADRHHTGQVNHKWYERRFRGSYGTGIEEDKYPTTKEFLNTINSWSYDPDKVPFAGSLPDAKEMTAYFNEALANNAWSLVHYQAREWREYLPEDSHERETAENYLAFAGNIVLQEYCRIAVTLAADQLADDDFVSVKHLFTVCWPMTLRLEPYIPDEVKRAKQLLRETFMQMAVRGTVSFRNHIELFGMVNLGQERMAGIYSRADNEKVAIKALMAFEDVDTEEAERIKQNLLERATKFAEAKKWYTAIDIIELSVHAYGWDISEFQELIDQYAIDGALYYTRDMSKMDEMRPTKIGKHEYFTCNAYELDGLRRAPGISEEAYQQISDIEELRQFEYDTQRLANATEEGKNIGVMKLFFSLSKTYAEVAQRFASPEIIESMERILTHETIGKVSGQRMDEIVAGIINLRNKGVLTTEQQNDTLTTIAEHILRRANDPNDHEVFDTFIGYISTILRTTKSASNPQEEVVWKFISPKQFDTFMNKLRGHSWQRWTEKRSFGDINWLQEQHFAFRENIREAWNEYWAEREEY